MDKRADPASIEERIRVACAIGNFLLAFNQIDLMTHRAISVLCDEPMLWGIASREWEFERRRALVIKLLEKRVAPPDLIEQWQREWSRTQTMADDRAHIAHGQMSALGGADEPPEKRIGVASLKKVAGAKPDFDMKLGQIEALIGETYQLMHRIDALIDRADACPWRDRLVPSSKIEAQGQ
jgi:hypothetical protein